MSEELIVPNELDSLKARADRMGIAYHPSIGVDKLREKVAAALADEPAVSTAPVAVEPVPAEVETLAQKRRRMKNDAMALVRIRLTCMNPAKKEWDGEIITAGNNLVGSVTKYVPFQAEEGWHIPRIMLNVLQARQCQVFTTLKSKGGVAIRQGKLIKEFAIEILPQLTADELHDLAQRQALAQSVG